MIKPISFSSISFKGESPVNSDTETQNTAFNTFAAQNTAIDTSVPDKPAASKFENAKTKVVNFFKGINNVTNTSAGAVRGAAEGAGAAVVVGAIGKNIKDSKGQIAGTLKGLGKDTVEAAKNIVLFVPSLLTNAPVKNIKKIASLPAKFYGKSYLNVLNKAGEGVKTHKATAAIATLTGLGVLALRTIQGKINANKKNADLDHKTNRGHIK